MSKFKSNKPTVPSRKKRAGEYLGKDIKSSDFLPSVFQTNINQAWLNASFDQMISKSDLQDVDELVGSANGKVYTPNDIYMKNSQSVNQLQPAVVSRDVDGQLTNVIGIDDIANSISLDFDEYNYNAAYSTRSSAFLPPIDVDKFLNYGQYYWITDLPVYESHNTQIVYTDVVAQINNEIEYTFKDDLNEFPLMDGMIIEFTTGYGDWDGYQVIVTGVGDLIRLRPYRNPQGRILWHDLTPYSGQMRGYWDRGQVKLFSRNQNNYSDPWTYIDNFNNTTSSPLLKLYDANLAKDIFVSGRNVARFDADWTFTNQVDSQGNPIQHDWAVNFVPTDLDRWKVFVIDTSTTGEISVTCILDARYTPDGDIEQFIPTNINNEFQNIAESIENYDVNAWDNDYQNNAEKDYILVDRADPIASAWSRVNYWIHEETLFKIAELTNTSDRYMLSRKEAQAKRPIIEFEKLLWMEDHGWATDPREAAWHGTVDFIVTTVQAGEDLGVGTTFVLKNDPNIYESTATGHVVKSTMQLGDTVFVLTGEFQYLIDKFGYQDVYWDGDKLNIAQSKQRINQAPLFKLYDENHYSLGDDEVYPNNSYMGNQLFGYKINHTAGAANDSELRFPIVYQDTGFKAEIVFENYLDRAEITYTKTLSTGSQIAQKTVIPGDYYYKQGLKFKTNYQASYKPLGSLTKHQVIVTDETQALQIPVGSDNWETNKEYLYYEDGINFMVRELYMKGVYHDFDQIRPELIMERNKTYEFHDLVGDLEIRDKDYNLVTNYLTPSTTAPDTYEINFDNNSNDYYYYGCVHLGFARIIVVDDINPVYHNLYIDGQFVPYHKYTVTATDIDIPASLLKKDSVVDVEYYTSEIKNTLDTEIPQVHAHNATNETLYELTFSSTMNHWRSIIESSVEFDGISHGRNNSHRKFSVKTNGGTIFKHDDLSIMHDLTLANDSLNITDALVEQGTEWDNFKLRFIGQIKSLYKQQSWASVKDMTNQAVKNITVTRRGTQLHKDSNMFYTNEDNVYVHELTGSNQTFTTPFTFNSDRTIQDHVYVYLTDDKDQTGKFVTRTLDKNHQYSINGSEITLHVSAGELPDRLPYVTVVYNEMDSASYVPASFAKLGLTLPKYVHAKDGMFVGHDGSITRKKGFIEFHDMESPDFDPVLAALYDLEVRIYSNLVRTEHYTTPWNYLPSQHRDTWYTLQMIDNAVEPHFRKWLNKNDVWDFISDDVYDPDNSSTWNYSTMDLHGHMEHLEGNTLPGSWQGQYIVLFGTERPDCMPWLMLGIPFKPDWWDYHYSWTDPVKRAALIKTLKTGHINHTGHWLSWPKQDLNVARYYWDWDNHCPVGTDGELVERHLVLGTPDPIDAAQLGTWGDWGYTERKWRLSAEGQAAHIAAILKLNRTRAWTDMFQPGFIRGAKNIATHNKVKPSELHYHGGLYGESVFGIVVTESTTGLDPNTTVDIVAPANTLTASSIANVDTDGKLTHVSVTTRGNYYDINTAKNVHNPNGSLFSHAEVDMIRKVIPFQANGINVVQANKLKRNNQEYNLEQLYSSVDTQLLVKMAGFTDKSVLKVYTESGLEGSFKLNDNDYEIVMLEGKPTRVDVASMIRIERVSQGYRITGISNSQQRFVFNEPITTGAKPYTNIELSNGVQIKNYNQHTTTRSYLEYGAVIGKVQDTYNFIRGYANYLESRGIQTEIDINNSAAGFAEWAISSQNREVYTINVGTAVGYTADHGHIMEFGTSPSKQNAVLDPYGDKMENQELYVYRNESELKVATRNQTVIGSAGFAEVDYEHGLLISNKTQFNSVIFDDVTNVRHQRLHLKGKKTAGWVGHKSAKGYLVREQGIDPNFDTSVNQIDYYYRTDVTVDNADIAKMEKITNGNIDRAWSNNFQLSDNVLSNFYREMIKDKGTTGVATKLNRSTLINLGDSKLTTTEEWMFRNGYMGDTTPVKTTEIEFKRQDGDDIRLVDFNNVTYVNNEIPVAFPKVTMDKKYSAFAGDVLSTEVDYVVDSIENIGNVFDNSADYANIPTWNGTTSYKRGDIVRRNGMLLTCATEFIGYSSQSTSLDFTGTIPSPQFSFRSQANGDTPSARIDSVNVWFDKTTTSFNNIVVNATTNSSVLSPTDINVDGESISLSSNLPQTIVDTTEPFNGNPFIRSNALGTGTVISDNLNKTLIIELQTIDLWDASDITTVTDPLTGAITSQTGVPLTAQQIVNKINAENITDVTATLESGGVIAISKNVNSSITGTLQIGNGSANADIGIVPAVLTPSLTVIQIPQQISQSDFVTAINARGISDVTASLDSQGRLVITKTPPIGVTASTTLVIGGSANSTFGFPATTTITSNQNPTTCDVDEARDFINAANIPGVTASVVQNRLKITSTNNQIELGDENNNFATSYDLETVAGIESGRFFKIEEQVENNFRDQFRAGYWDQVPEDPAHFNIFVLDDSDMASDNVDGIASKYWGWNVMQVQATGLYTEDTPPGSTSPTEICSICAGDTSPEGNDARVTVNNTHNLRVGDYVMLLNTTTQPSCDGIHRVTRVGNITEPNSFYIDMYIEECGFSPAVFAVRNAKFENTADRNAALTSASYDIPVNSLAWSTFDANGVQSTNVHKFDGQAWVELTDRYSNNRIIHDTVAQSKQLVGATIYDHKKQITLLDLELYDPARGLIPGVIAREIDNQSPFDLAQYTHSTDLLFEGNDRNAWSGDQESITWWDTSNLKYWDYDQGDYNYRKQHWGKLVPGSTIDVYEWTKSTVPPDEYADAVQQGTEMFGIVATGTAYSLYDSALGEDVYYYTQVEEWDEQIKDYYNVYFFWVKDKLYTNNKDRLFTANQLTTVLQDPNSNGISWIAPIDSEQLIISNVGYYLNDNTVLQLTFHADAFHNNWFILNEGSDVVPEYWFRGVRDNITGIQSGYEIELPNMQLHPWNRYGDDRKIGQSWYKNKYEARRQALSIANSLLKEINLFEDLPGKWDRTISRKSRIIDLGVDADLVPDWLPGESYQTGDRVISKRVVYEALSSFTSGTDEIYDINTNDWVMISQLYDMTRTWGYTEYVHKLHPAYKQPTLSVASRGDVLLVDPLVHQTVIIPIYDNKNQRDESETFNWVNDSWLMTKKNNATIAFNDFISNPDNDFSWDSSPWDNGGWDQNTAIYAYYIVEALRNDIFIQTHQDDFNKFFFGMVKYAISVQKQVDWVYKTTYIQAEIGNKLNVQPKVYKKNTVNEIVGYLETVKPFHTKVRSVFDKYDVDEFVRATVTDSHLIDITLDATQLDPNETFIVEWDSDRILASSFTADDFGQIVSGGSFTDEVATVYTANGFNNPYDLNTTGATTGNSGERRAIYYFDPSEHLAINVITNTSGSTVDVDSRTFAYLQDNNGYTQVYVLEDAKTSTVVTDVQTHETTIELAAGEGVKFTPTNGYALINNEVIHYASVDGDTLVDVTRAAYAAKIVSGDTIVDVTNNKLDTIKSIRHDSSVRLNEIGKSILDNSSSSLDSKALQANGQGTAF